MEQSTIALTVTSGTDLSFLAVVVLICAPSWMRPGRISYRCAERIWMPAQ